MIVVEVPAGTGAEILGMLDPPCSLADLLALPDVDGMPPADRLRLYKAYLHWQLTRPDGVEWGNMTKHREARKERQDQGHLSPLAEKALAFVAEHGIVSTIQVIEYLEIPRGALFHKQGQLVDAGYIEHRPGVACRPGSWRITRAGLERLGLDPDTPVPADLPPAPLRGYVPDDTMVTCGGPCGETKAAVEFYRLPWGGLRKQCKLCQRAARRKVS